MAVADDMNARLDRFLVECAEPDWDSYGAEPISPASVEVARRWVPIMAAIPGCVVAPVPSGGVLFEWEEDGVDVEWECWSARRADLRKEQGALE